MIYFTHYTHYTAQYAHLPINLITVSMYEVVLSPIWCLKLSPSHYLVLFLVFCSSVGKHSKGLNDKPTMFNVSLGDMQMREISAQLVITETLCLPIQLLPEELNDSLYLALLYLCGNSFATGPRPPVRCTVT